MLLSNNSMSGYLIEPWERALCIDDFFFKTSIHKGFSMAMLHSQMVYTLHILDGGLEHVLFFHILGMIIPLDSYFSEG